MDETVTEDMVSGPSGRPGRFKRCWDSLKVHACLSANLASVVVGISLGLVLKFYFKLSKADKYYIALPGDLLLQLLQSTSIPLIVTSVITGVYGLGNKTSRKVTLCTAAYVSSTTLVAVITGLVLVLSIKPGVADYREETEDSGDESHATVTAIYNLFMNIFPPNPIQACFQQFKAEVEVLETENETLMKFVHGYVDGTNILGLICWSVFIGLVLNSMGREAENLIDVLIAINESTKSFFRLILWYLPVGIMFLITTHTLEVHDWENMFKLAKFMGVILLGYVCLNASAQFTGLWVQMLLYYSHRFMFPSQQLQKDELVIHGVIVLPLIYFLCTRCNPLHIIKGIAPALLTALLLSSSSATGPHTFRCLEERLKIDKKLTRLMLPILTTINMNGTALYEVVAAVFVTQISHINLNLGQLVSILVMSSLCTVGAAGLPATGAMTTLFVLSAVRLPAKEAALLVAIEWLLDRCNTVVNVYGDCMGVAIVDKVLTTKLEELEAQRPTTDDSEAGGISLVEVQVQVNTSADAYDTASES